MRAKQFLAKYLMVGIIIGGASLEAVNMYGQRVGIGTTSPIAKLHIEFNSSQVGIPLVISKQGGSVIFVVDSLGRVGIQNPFPAEALDVSGNIAFSGALMPGGNPGSAGQVLLSQGPGTPPQWSDVSAVGDNWGTQVAQTQPPIIGDGTASNPIGIQPGTNAGDILVWDGSQWQVQAPGTSSGIPPICNSAAVGFVQKWTGTDLCNTIIYEDGVNVGIGTASPTQKLDVAGNIQFSGALMPGGNAGNAGDILISQGANTPPIWKALPSVASREIVYVFTAPNIVCATSTTSYTTIVSTSPITLLPGDTVIVMAMGDINPSNSCSPPDANFQACGQACANIVIVPDATTGLNDLGGNNGGYECIHWSEAFSNHVDRGDNFNVIKVYEVTANVTRQFSLQALYDDYFDAGCYPKFWSSAYIGASTLIVKIIR